MLLLAASGLDDLLGGLDLAPAPAAAAVAAPVAAAGAAAAAAAAADPFDLLGGGTGPSPAAAAAAASAPAHNLPLLLDRGRGRGLTVHGRMERAGGQLVYRLAISNGSQGPVDGFLLQVNANSYGLAPADQVRPAGCRACVLCLRAAALVCACLPATRGCDDDNTCGHALPYQVVAVGSLAPGASGSAAVVMAHNPAKQAAGPVSSRLQVRSEGWPRACGAGASLVHRSTLGCTCSLAADARLVLHRTRARAAAPQVAMKTSQLGVFYWDDAVPLAALLQEGGAIDGNAFLSAWRSLPGEAGGRLDVTVGDIDAASAALRAVNLFVLAHRPVRAGCAQARQLAVHVLWCCCCKRVLRQTGQEHAHSLTLHCCCCCCRCGTRAALRLSSQVPGTGQDALYVTGRVFPATQVLLELRLLRGSPGVDASFKSERPELAEPAMDVVRAALGG